MSNSGTGDSMVPATRWGTVELPPSGRYREQRVACAVCLNGLGETTFERAVPILIVMINGTSYCLHHAPNVPYLSPVKRP